jgi:predicted RNA-binding protein YlqC (UPF0109 family)
VDDHDAIARMVVEVARALVDEPDAVSIEIEETDRETQMLLQVADDDMGHVIGRGGRVAEALRVLVREAARARDVGRINLKIVESEERRRQTATSS